ncbi:MAG: hypothetical protein AAB388_04970 [Patescibacteria group bacterium]
MSIPIVPAVIPNSAEEIKELTKILRFSRELHLDLVDGVFVKNTSWPFNPSGDARMVKAHTDAFTLEVDLMVANPLPVAEEWIAAGADMLVFHIETITLEAFTRFTTHTSVSLGVSLHGATPLEALFPYIAHADYIQLMGIYEIGSQGQPFDEAVLAKITVLKQQFPHKPIHVDGSVNKNTVLKLKQAGANRLVCGSAIVKQPDPEAAYHELRTLVNE